MPTSQRVLPVGFLNMIPNPLPALGLMDIGVQRSATDLEMQETMASPYTDRYAKETNLIRTAAVILIAMAVGVPVSHAEEPAAPSQVVQMKAAIAKLQKAKGAAFLGIHEKDGEGMVQVTGGKGMLRLNIAYYPSKKKPDKAFPEAGITIPGTWRRAEFVAETYVQYQVPASEAEDLPLFIHDIFLKFFKSKPEYKIQCFLEQF